MGSRHGIPAVLSVIAGFLISVPDAHGVATCSYDALSETVAVNMSQSADNATLSVSGGNIVLNGTGGNPCTGGPTTTNTDTINVSGGAGQQTFTILVPADFQPGVTAEGVPEIEFNINLGTGDTFDSVGFRGGTGSDSWVLGSNGMAPEANFNGDTDSEFAIVTGIDNGWSLNGEGGNDVITAQGGTGIGTAFVDPAPLTVQGGEADDTIVGGDRAAGDLLIGNQNNDELIGMGGADSLAPGDGNDAVQGNAGTDTADFGFGTSPVTVDRSISVPQDTGQGLDTLNPDVEQVAGSNGSDTLLGSPGPDGLFGGFGNDVVDGRAGDDTLGGGNDFGGGGLDTLTYAAAPAGVTANLTTGQASGGFGTDTVSGFENLTGSPFADSLTGDAAANTITGLGGPDNISALAGPDDVQIRDGEADVASCGSEIDSATADRQSLDTVDPDCETTSFLPEPEDGGGADTEVIFELRGRGAQDLVKQRGLVVKGLCPTEDCTATVAAKVKLPRPKGGKSASAKLSPKPVTRALVGGIAQKIKLRLRRKQVKAVAAALRDDAKVRAKVFANVTDAAGNLASAKRKVKAKG